jgi:hypothetical protein
VFDISHWYAFDVERRCEEAVLLRGAGGASKR